MDIQEIYALMDRFDRSGLGRMELEMTGVKLTLQKGGDQVYAGADGSVRTVVQEQRAADPAEQFRERLQDLTQIKAPLVGTFYRAPGPGEAPFVKEGQSVKKGDVVGVIEAMKLMNEIVAPEDGVVEKITVTDGSLVEYNQILMTLKQGEG